MYSDNRFVFLLAQTPASRSTKMHDVVLRYMSVCEHEMHITQCFKAGRKIDEVVLVVYHSKMASYKAFKA